MLAEIPSTVGLHQHCELGQPCSDAMHANNWKTTLLPAFDDLDKHKDVFREVPNLEYDDNTPASLSNWYSGKVCC
jgi:hypothetical protein